MSENARQLAAILSTDVVAYSQLMSMDEARTDAVVRQALDDMEGIVEQFRGHIISLQGDGFIAIFDSATKSVECATKLAELVAGERYPLDDSHLEFRTGMCLGEIIVRDESAFGEAVNIAKRLEQAAQPGQTWVSESLYQHAVGRTAAGFEYLGEKELKNIPRRIAVYRLVPTLEAAARSPSPRAPAADGLDLGRPVLAVLPIDDFSENKDKSWLCDCITEEIILRTSKFREIPVISRNSVFAIRGNSWSIGRIAEELHAAYILEGSIRTAGSQVRLTAQLIDSKADRHVWSDSFVGDLDDVFSLQDAISEAVVGHLVGRIEVAEEQRIRRPHPSSTSYEAVARARQFYWQGDRAALDESERICRKCIADDPLYASAWSLLSRICNTRWLFGWSEDTAGAMREAEAAARKAIALDVSDGRAHTELSQVLLYQHLHAQALKAHERALSINPNDADIIAEYADTLHYSGRADEALDLMRRAMALNPYYPDWYLWILADIYFVLDRLEDVIATVQQMRNPLLACRLTAASFALLGREEEARRAAEDVLLIAPKFSVEEWTHRQPDMDEKNIEKFTKGLKLAGLPD